MNDTLYVNGTELTVRLIEVTDVDRLARMFGRLSRESVRMRFFSPIPRLPWPALLRLTYVDHWRREAFVAVDGDEIVAVARYSVTPDSHPGSLEAELAVTVEDAWQHLGIGRQLTRRLTELARSRGYDAFVARILPENHATLALVHDVAPDAALHFAGGEYDVRFALREVAYV